MPVPPTSQTPDLADWLWRRWYDLWQKLLRERMNKSVHMSLKDEFGRLIEHYTEAHRAYHRLEHLEYLFDLHDKYWYLADDRDALELAIWFHDVIYDTKKVRERSESNELLSERYAREVMSKFGISSTLQNVVSGLIMVTRHIPGSARTRDEMLMADMDWSPLGCPWKQFAQNGMQLEFEELKSGANAEDVRKGRVAFLAAALEHKDGREVVHPQYYLPEFQKKFEKQAIRNMKRALKELKKAS